VIFPTCSENIPRLPWKTIKSIRILMGFIGLLMEFIGLLIYLYLVGG
jgi:hypothetical protein